MHRLTNLLGQLHLSQLQHSHGPLRGIYWTLVHVPPILVVVCAAAAYLCLSYLRRNVYAIPAAILLCYFGLLFGLPGGKAVISNAATHPVIEQPRCLLDATLAGAIWDKSKLQAVHACVRIASGKPSGAVSDDAKDGSLTGTFDGPHFVAQATVPEQPPWQAITIPEGGMRVIYFSLGGSSDRLSACPDVTGVLPAGARADQSGHAFTAAFAAGADRSLLAQLFPGASSFAVAGAGRYRVLAHGSTVAFLLPVSGSRGNCAFLAPYAQITADEWRLVDRPSAADLTQLSQFAAAIHLDGLKPNTSH